MNVATMTCKTALGSLSGFVIYFAEDIAVSNNMTEVWHKHFESFFTIQNSVHFEFYIFLNHEYSVAWCSETSDYEIEYE